MVTSHHRLASYGVPVGSVAQYHRDSLPYVTHEGELDIAGIKLRVYLLSDGRRVTKKEDLARFFEAG